MNLTPERELELLRFLESLSAQLKPTRDVEKALRYSLRMAMDFFQAASGAVAVLHPGGRAVEIKFAYPRDTGWDLELLEAFIRGEPARIPPDLLLGQLR